MNIPEIKNKIKEARKTQIFPLEDTAIEKKIFALLDKCLIKYRKHAWIDGLLVHTPYKYHRFDIVIDRRQTIIEVQGCYWHGCKNCFPNPSKKQIEWIKRDKDIKEIAEKEGWNVVYLWKHDIKKDADINSAYNIAYETVLRRQDERLKAGMIMGKTCGSLQHGCLSTNLICGSRNI